MTAKTLLLLSVILPPTPTFADAPPQLADVIREVADHEALFDNLDWSLKINYELRDTRVGPKGAIVRSIKHLRSIAQEGRLYYSWQETGSTNDGAPLSRDWIGGFDGVTARTEDRTTENVVREMTIPGNVRSRCLRPHLLVLSRLRPDEKSLAEVLARPIASNRDPVETRFEESEIVNGMRCLRLVIESSHKGVVNVRRRLWLARDFHDIPVKTAAYFIVGGVERLAEEGEVTEWIDVTKTLRCPMACEVRTFVWSAPDDPQPAIGNVTTTRVEHLKLNPGHDLSIFRELPKNVPLMD